MAKTKKLKIRPYARLLTMLGEQLIKNERIALIELIKNAYDADASWVKISFANFGNNFQIKQTSKIVIEDSGDGMNYETIEKHWLNPATPVKKRKKRIKETTKKGRIIQGDKGIGRFSILKLGRNIKIITRIEGENTEHLLRYNFSNYDDEFLSEKGVNDSKADDTGNNDKDIFLDDLSVLYESREPQAIIGRNISLGLETELRPLHGTRIEISDLKGSWTTSKVENVYSDIARLESIFTYASSKSKKASKISAFRVMIYKDKKHQKFQERYLEDLNSLLKYSSVIRVEDGEYNEKNQLFKFKLNGTPRVLKLRDPQIVPLNVFKIRFGERGVELDKRSTECGSFKFGFYVFDFSKKAPPKYKLEDDDRKLIRNHRIYLYRDGIRVYPYGEPDDDWLRIDIHRGTVSAAQFLSNDQVVGYVNITQKSNPNLKDKTSREGLLDEGNATEDFVTLIRTLLRWVRDKPFKKYQLDLQDKSRHDIFQSNQIQLRFDELKTVVKKDKKASNLVHKAEKEYQAERQYLVRRAEITEDLAGVGLSVETASHDIMAIMEKATINLDSLISDTLHAKKIDAEQLHDELHSLRGGG